MHDIQYDEIHDEFVMSNPIAQAILTFRGGANGEEAPIRVLQGPSTQMMDPDHVAVDPVHDEMFVFEAEFILVFPRTANGDAAPIRVIRGPDTQLRRGRALVVDPVTNLLVVTVDYPEPDAGYGMLIFNRTDNGNVKPRAMIAGPKTRITGPIDHLQIYSPKGLIVAALTGSGRRDEDEQRGSRRDRRQNAIGVWSLKDNGDVPPLWYYSGPKSSIQGRRIALNPKGKEVILGGGTMVQAYSFPEIF